jgi:hypothetical protein
MGEERRQRYIAIAAVLHGILAAAWFVLGIIVPSAGALRDALLLVPTFVATGVLMLGDPRLPPELWRHLAWAAAFIDIIGLPPLGLYMARIVLARTAPTANDTRWTTSDGLSATVAALVLISATALAHFYTIVVALRYVYAARRSKSRKRANALGAGGGSASGGL